MDDTFNPAALTRSDTLTSNVSTIKPTTSSASKASKTTQNFPRIDYEPLYAELKSLITDDWGTYIDAVGRFMQGGISENEFGDLTDNFLRGNPVIEHAHNSFVLAILHNTGRDSPDPGPAPWVSASSDKSSGPSTSKPAITSDVSEQRLKTEVKALPARDRRRIKTLFADIKDAPDDTLFRRAAYEDYYNASRIKAPDTVPASAGGLTKTNWDLEIRKRYTQPLFAETLEFPDAATIHARMVPICYEESVAAGTSLQCAELVGIAAEMHVKNMLHDIFNRVRVNGPRYENGAAGGAFTAKFKKQLQRQEAEVKIGKLTRTRDDDMLPIESKESQARKPLSITDLKLANRVGPNIFNGMPLLGVQVNESLFDDSYDEQDADTQESSQVKNTQNQQKHSIPAMNGATTNGTALDDDEMDLDEEDWGWEGTGLTDRTMLGNLLGNLDIHGRNHDEGQDLLASEHEAEMSVHVENLDDPFISNEARVDAQIDSSSHEGDRSREPSLQRKVVLVPFKVATDEEKAQNEDLDEPTLPAAETPEAVPLAAERLLETPTERSRPMSNLQNGINDPRAYDETPNASQESNAASSSVDVTIRPADSPIHGVLATTPCSSCNTHSEDCEVISVKLIHVSSDTTTPFTFSLGCAPCIRQGFPCSLIPNSPLRSGFAGSFRMNCENCKGLLRSECRMVGMRMRYRVVDGAFEEISLEAIECSRCRMLGKECQMPTQSKYRDARRYLARMKQRQREAVFVDVQAMG